MQSDHWDRATAAMLPFASQTSDAIGKRYNFHLILGAARCAVTLLRRLRSPITFGVTAFIQRADARWLGPRLR
jgi:hypothetical protein